MATIAAAHGQHRLLPRTSTRASVSVRVTSVIIVVIAAVAAVSCVNAGVVDVALSFNQVSPLHVVDPLYLCFNIDTGSLFNGMDFSDKLLRAYTKQLAPAMLRRATHPLPALLPSSCPPLCLACCLQACSWWPCRPWPTPRRC